MFVTESGNPGSGNQAMGRGARPLMENAIELAVGGRRDEGS